MIPSIFIVGMVKSGSTLLNRIMRPISTASGLTYRSPANEFVQRGLELRDAALTFEPLGVAYGGFRDLPWPLPEFAADRTVMLVRDPRDALTSLYYSVAYSHVPPGTAESSRLLESFEARRARALSLAIDEFVMQEAPGQARLIKRTLANAPRHRRYRYEDVIFDKPAWVADMVDYLRLSLPQRQVEAIVARNDVVPEEDAPNEHIRHVTPGDHRDKLKPETIVFLNKRLEGVLQSLGYD